MPMRRMTRFSSRRVRSRSVGSRFESGSSSSSTRGRGASARASATRCCWPPESCVTRRSLEAGEVDQRRASPRRALARGSASSCPAPRGRRRRSRRPSGAERARSAGTPCRSGGARAAARVTSSPSTRMRARVGRLEAGDQPQHGRLAAAGRAEQRDDLALRDRRARRRASTARSPKRLSSVVEVQERRASAAEPMSRARARGAGPVSALAAAAHLAVPVAIHARRLRRRGAPSRACAGTIFAATVLRPGGQPLRRQSVRAGSRKASRGGQLLRLDAPDPLDELRAATPGCGAPLTRPIESSITGVPLVGKR